MYIIAHASNWNWHSKDSQINLNSFGTNATRLNWSIPIYNDDGFIPSEGSFYLRVEFSGDNGFEISIPARPFISSANADVGDLGSVSLRYITLSGTINVTVNGQQVPYIQIYAGGNNGGGWSWLTSPRANAAWSVYLPYSDYPSEVSFYVSGFQNKDGNSIFWKNINPDPPVYASNQNTTGISLNVGNIKTITLSGTLNVTVNGQPVPRVEIEVRSDYGWYNNSSTQLTSPGVNAPWSITLPAFDSPTQVYFDIEGYSANGDRLFNETINPDPPVYVQDQNKSGIILNVGDKKAITLSGTLNVTIDGQPVPRVEIEVRSDYGWYSYSTSLTSPGVNAPWSITLPAFDSPTQVSFYVSGYSANWDNLFGEPIQPNPPVNAYNQNISNISLNIGNIANPNTPVNPTLLTANTWANGNITTYGGVQWFEFTATNSTQYIHVNFGSLDDLYVQVYNSSGATVGYQENLYGSTKYTNQYLTSGQQYYIRVWPYNPSDRGTFQIAFNTSSTAPGGSSGGNDNAITFSQLADAVGITIPSSGMTLNDFFLQAPEIGISYDTMVQFGFLLFYKNEALTQPYSGSDWIYADTMIYTESSLF